MFNFLKKEKKIIIITVLTLILVIAVNSFAIQPEKDSAKKSKSNADKAISRWNSEIEKLFEYYDGKDLALAPPREHVKIFRQLNEEAREKELALQNVVAFEIKENFRLPNNIVKEAIDDEYPQLIMDFANRKIAELLDDTYTKIESAKYKFLKPLNLDNPLAQSNLAFDEYKTEALPLVGKRAEIVNQLEDQIEKEIIFAEAEATMKLTQLNIIKVIIENARVADVSKMNELMFVSRPSELASKFNVKQNDPQYYRPIVVQVKITGLEQSIFDFLRMCIDPSPTGSTGEFLAIHSFLLDNPEALDPNTPTLEVSAEMKLVAFIIDPQAPFSEFEKPKKRSIIPSYGYGPMHRGGGMADDARERIR